ncbi:hypothetical protein B566_EDAN015298, partial [Ephemera danica]
MVPSTTYFFLVPLILGLLFPFTFVVTNLKVFPCSQIPPPYRPSLALLRAGLWTGWISAFGISMVGNFQFSNMPVVHGLGALLCFGVGIASLWIQVDPGFDGNLQFHPDHLRCRSRLRQTWW